MKGLVLQILRFYQRFLSPLLGGRCRFYPSCSAYAVKCYENFGFFKATGKTFYRVARCHPLHPGGWDPAVPPPSST